MQPVAGSPALRRRALSLRRPRLLALALAVSIPAWWYLLHWWVESTYGYLDLEVIGVSPLAWIGLLALAAIILAIRPSGPAAAGRVVIGLIGVAGAVLALHNLAEGLADGAISPRGLVIAGLSILQLTAILTGAFAPAEP